MLGFGSSLVDLAIYRETRMGRKVLMDFNRNPEPVPGDAPFSLERLDADVRAYLENNRALLDLPIERLAKMNPLSIELYRRCNISGYPSRSIGWVRCSGIKRITTKPGARRVAGPARLD